jgi:hypothetical protein
MRLREWCGGCCGGEWGRLFREQGGCKGEFPLFQGRASGMG